MSEEKCKQALGLTWQLVQQYHELLGVVVPTAHEIAEHLVQDRKPSPERIDAWTKINDQVTAHMLELNAKLEAVRQTIRPYLPPFDA